MISPFYKSQLPAEVLNDPMANDDNLYLLGSLLLFRQLYTPKSVEEIQQFVLGTQRVLQWPLADFEETWAEVSILLAAHEDLLENHVFIVFNQPAARA